MDRWTAVPSTLRALNIARFLPLSNRPHDDESAVSGDWRVALAEIVDEAARLSGEAASADASRVEARFLRRARLSTGPKRPAARDLRALAVALRSGKRAHVRDLAHAMRALLQLADERAVTAEIPDATLGAVALYAATTADFERRAVVSGHTVRASDAEWEFGRGPVLEETGQQIVRFLLGLSDTPPRPV